MPIQITNRFCKVCHEVISDEEWEDDDCDQMCSDKCREINAENEAGL